MGIDIVHEVTQNATMRVRSTLVATYDFEDESDLLTIVFSMAGNDLIHLGAATDRDADAPTTAEIVARLRAAADQIEARHACNGTGEMEE